MSWWDEYKKTLLDSLNKFPQYDPNSGGIDPTGGPMIPKAPAPPAAPGMGYAADVARPYGDVDTVASLSGVTRRPNPSSRLQLPPRVPMQMNGNYFDGQPVPLSGGSVPLRMLSRRNY